MSIFEDSGDFPEFANDRNAGRKAAARIKGVFETIRNYKVPIVVLEHETSVESVCRVFETINSTGTRLKTFDLAVARFYPEPDLRQLWSDTQDKFPILKEFEVDGERVLQVLFQICSVRDRMDSEPTRSNLLGLSPKDINSKWEKSSKALAETYKWARVQGARPKTLPSENTLVPLAAVQCVDDFNQDQWTSHQSLIRRWYFSKIMRAGASQASNYRIGQDFQALHKWLTSEKVLLEPAEVTLSTEIILGLKPSDVRYKSLQNVFATTIRHDLLSGNNIKSESDLHDHHIFPKNAGKKHGLPQNMLDGICNRVPVLAGSNQSLGEKYPRDYFKEMADRARDQGTLGELKRRISDCLIPGDSEDPEWADSFGIDQFEHFCRQRAELILSRVQEIVGDSLRTSSSPDDELAEDSDV